MPHAAVNGIDLFYEDRGAGDPVVFISGLMGGIVNWAPQVDELSRDYRCISIDNRGVGGTGAIPGPYSIGMFADDVAGLIEHLGIERCHVIGSSMGGMIAQRLALGAPRVAASLSLHCTAPRSDEYIRRVSYLYATLARQFEVIDEMWVDVLCFSHDTYNARRDEIAALEEGLRKAPMSAAAFRSQLAALADHDAEADLPKVRCPTLVGCGTEDAWMPPSAARRIVELIPDARLELFEGMGHLYKWEDPHRFVRIQGDFLRDVPFES